jgi:hypothetical protein
MIKLIKLSNIHYIVVDKSEIREDDKFITLDTKQILTCEGFVGGKVLRKAPVCDGIAYPNAEFLGKITHSTQRMRGVLNIQLSDIENLFDLSVDDRSIREYGSDIIYTSSMLRDAFSKGFRESDELNSDKLFTEDDMRNCWISAANNVILALNDLKSSDFYEFIKSVSPKTEWEIEFDETGKIKLK